MIGRTFFLLYHIRPLQSFLLSEILLAYVYGLRLDLSFASYISILPAAVTPVLLVFNVRPSIIRLFLLIYSLLWTIVLALIFTIDAELFSFWGFRLDNTLFRYSGTIGEAIGSTLSSPLLLLILFLLLYSYSTYMAYKKLLYRFVFESLHLYWLPVCLFVAALFVIPIRGGLQQIPINESVSYYSNHPFLNQAALNPAWTLARSAIEQNGPDVKRYAFLDPSEVDSVLSDVKPATQHILSPLTTARPNILLIVWESLTSKVVNDTVTPHLHKLLHEGIYFSSLYASGDRSDKGLVALLSAYPAQPDYSIMTEPGKSRKLPFITQQLKSAGYQSCYLYGGELEFANMKSYMNYNGFDRIIGKNDFPEESWGAKWGAHDEATYNALFEYIQADAIKKNPFFYTLFTLSSHEPYDVPVKPFFKGRSKTIQFQNSHHYADSCFYDFIQKAKKQSWWKNTWVIVIGDHGHVLPGNDYATHKPNEFHIPMLWLGGALTDTLEIKQTYSQIHLGPTIARYLNLNPNAFQFSQPIDLKDTAQKYAWYSYSDGFVCVRDQNNFVQYDLNSQQVSQQKGHISAQDLTWSKAFLQRLMEDFHQK